MRSLQNIVRISETLHISAPQSRVPLKLVARSLRSCVARVHADALIENLQGIFDACGERIIGASASALIQFPIRQFT